MDCFVALLLAMTRWVSALDLNSVIARSFSDEAIQKWVLRYNENCTGFPLSREWQGGEEEFLLNAYDHDDADKPLAKCGFQIEKDIRDVD